VRDEGQKSWGWGSMELVEEVKELLIQAAKALKGSEKRLFMARTVRALGKGGKTMAQRELGWNRTTIRKGEHELESGVVCVDAFKLRGRKRSEEHLPNLLKDITAIVDGQSQTDPQFRTNRLYTRLTATEVRRQLIVQKGYSDDELPTAETITTKLNELGYSLKKVAKTQPQKTSRNRRDLRPPEADQKGRQMQQKPPYAFRWMPRPLSTSVPLRRVGKSRVLTKAADHDFHPSLYRDSCGDFPARLR
jgi:hypothetical protein